MAIIYINNSSQNCSEGIHWQIIEGFKTKLIKLKYLKLNLPLYNRFMILIFIFVSFPAVDTMIRGEIESLDGAGGGGSIGSVGGQS